MYFDKKKHKPRYFYLFNDMLLITKKKAFGSNVRYNIKIWVNLSNIKLDKNLTFADYSIFSEEQTKMLPEAFQLRSTTKTLLFFTASQENCKEWVDAFERVLAKVVEGQETKKVKSNSVIN